MATHNRNVERVARESADITIEQVDKLKSLFPEAITEGRVDFDRLRTALGEAVDSRQERYSFKWAGKRDAISYSRCPAGLP